MPWAESARRRVPEHGSRSVTNNLVPESTSLGYLRRGKRSACTASCSRKAERQLPDQPSMPSRCSSETELLRGGGTPIPLAHACLPGRFPGAMSQMLKQKQPDWPRTRQRRNLPDGGTEGGIERADDAKSKDE